MNNREFMTALKSGYSASQLPDAAGERQYKAYLSSCRYSPVQLSKLLSQVLKQCEYFPNIAQLVRCANECGLHSGEKPREPNWRIWYMDGYCYARREGYLQHERSIDRHARWQQEACSPQEGQAIYRQAYNDYCGERELIGEAVIDDHLWDTL